MKTGPGPEMWNQRYGQDEFAYGRAANDFLVEQADLIPDGPVLCLGAGEGRNAVFLAERGHQVTAVDQSAAGLAKAQRLAGERGVELHTEEANLAVFEVGSSTWAGMTSIFCHVPGPLRTQLHRKVVEGLRPGGVFVFEAYRPAQLELKTGGPPVRELLVELAELEEELGALELLLAREHDRVIEEGKHHSGPSAVVQLVGRKRA